MSHDLRSSLDRAEALRLSMGVTHKMIQITGDERLIPLKARKRLGLGVTSNSDSSPQCRRPRNEHRSDSSVLVQRLARFLGF